MSKKQLDMAELSGFTGSEQWFRHALARNVVYSEGVKYVAETYSAFWLIDAIASHLAVNPKIKKERQKNERFARLHFWNLRKTGESSAVLEAVEDSGMKPVDSQEIPYTDFPFPADGMFKVYVGDDGPGTPVKIFLPSEY